VRAASVEEDTRETMKPWEYQNWIARERFNGTVFNKGGDKGIDGFTFMVHEPIQVKQSGQRLLP
jgi:hypothetical protein